MSEENQNIVTGQEEGWQSRTLMVGSVVGAFLGFLSAYLYVKSAEETYGEAGPPEAPGTKDALKLGTSIVAIVRMIMDWGRR